MASKVDFAELQNAVNSAYKKICSDPEQSNKDVSTRVYCEDAISGSNQSIKPDQTAEAVAQCIDYYAPTEISSRDAERFISWKYEGKYLGNPSFKEIEELNTCSYKLSQRILKTNYNKNAVCREISNKLHDIISSVAFYAVSQSDVNHDKHLDINELETADAVTASLLDYFDGQGVFSTEGDLEEVQSRVSDAYMDVVFGQSLGLFFNLLSKKYTYQTYQNDSKYPYDPIDFY